MFTSEHLARPASEPAAGPVGANARPMGDWFPRAGVPCAEPLAGVGARPVCDDDLGFLYALYVSTRLDELAALDWCADQKAAFLHQQFQAQHQYYVEHYPDALRLLLLLEGQPIGRLYWWSGEATANLIDVSLLPAVRGRGIGQALMTLLTAQADRAGQAVVLHVEPHNPAHRLYRRHGFATVAQSGVYDKMRRPAQGKPL